MEITCMLTWVYFVSIALIVGAVIYAGDVKNADVFIIKTMINAITVISVAVIAGMIVYAIGTKFIDADKSKTVTIKADAYLDSGSIQNTIKVQGLISGGGKKD